MVIEHPSGSAWRSSTNCAAGRARQRQVDLPAALCTTAGETGGRGSAIMRETEDGFPHRRGGFCACAAPANFWHAPERPA